MLAEDPPLANVEDMAIPRCVANGEEAIAVVREYHAAWLLKQRSRQLESSGKQP